MASHRLKKLLIISTTAIGLLACNNHGGTNDYNAKTSSLQSAKMLNSDDDVVEAPTFTWVSGESNIVNVQAVAKKRDVADINNTPGNRDGASMWADRDGNIWLFGGVYTKITNGVEKQFLSNTMWKYNIKAKTWTWASGDLNNVVVTTQGHSIDPGGRIGAITWIDENDDLWMVGGVAPINVGQDYQYVREVWKFSTSKYEAGVHPWVFVGNFGIGGAEYTSYTPVSNNTKQTNPAAAKNSLDSRFPSLARGAGQGIAGDGAAVTYADGVLHMFGGRYVWGLNDFWHYNSKGFDGIPVRKWIVDEPTEYIPNPYKPIPEEFKDFKAGERYLGVQIGGSVGSYGVLDATMLQNNRYPNLSRFFDIAENNYPSARAGAVLIDADQPNTLYLYGGTVDLLIEGIYTKTGSTSGWYGGASHQIWKYSNGSFDLISGCLGYVNFATDRWEESDTQPYSKKCVGDWQHAPAGSGVDLAWSDKNGNLWVWNKGRNLYMFDFEKRQWSQVIKDKDQTTAVLPGIYGTKNVASVNNRPQTYSNGVRDFEGNYWMYGGVRDASVNNSGFSNTLWKISVHSKSKPEPEVNCENSICITPLPEKSHTWRDSFMEIPLEVRFGLKGYTITNASAESVTQIKLNTLFPNDDFSIDTTYSNCVDGKGLMVTKLKPKQSCELVLRYHPMEVADGDFSLSVVGITELSQTKLRSKSVTIEYSTLAGPSVPLKPYPAVKDEVALTMCDTQNDPSVPFKPIPAFNHKLCVKSIEPELISWRDSLRDIPFQVDTNGKVNSRIGKKGLLITNISTVPNEVISQIKVDQDFPSSDFSIDYSMSSCFSYTPSIQSVHLDPGHSCTMVLKYVPTKELNGSYGFSIKGSALNNTAVVYAQYLNIMYSSYKLTLD